MNKEILRGQGINPKKFNREIFTQFQTWLGETKGVEGCPINLSLIHISEPTRPY